MYETNNLQTKKAEYEIPILLLIFNRKDSALMVVDEIRKQRPKHMYVAADGPRIGNMEDLQKCEDTRKAILEAIDWECDLKTFFRDENRGCGYAPAEAISWFFDQVEYGIILEDDIIPSKTFFPFCKELLIKYKDDEKVMSIAGTNFVSQTFKSKDSYYFTNYAGGWGWASWKRAWKCYDYNISEWEKLDIKKKIRKKFSKEGYAFWEEAFDLVCNKNIDHIWDYQWAFSKMVNDGVGIIPSVNLTTNIGFGKDATHTFDVSDDIQNANINEEISFPLTHPKVIKVNTSFDTYISKKFFSKTQKKQSIKLLLKKIYWKITQKILK